MTIRLTALCGAATATLALALAACGGGGSGSANGGAASTTGADAPAATTMAAPASDAALVMAGTTNAAAPAAAAAATRPTSTEMGPGAEAFVRRTLTTYASGPRPAENSVFSGEIQRWLNSGRAGLNGLDPICLCSSLDGQTIQSLTAARTRGPDGSVGVEAVFRTAAGASRTVRYRVNWSAPDGYRIENVYAQLDGATDYSNLRAML